MHCFATAQSLLDVAMRPAGTGCVLDVSTEGGTSLVLALLVELLTQRSEGLSSIPLETVLSQQELF